MTGRLVYLHGEPVPQSECDHGITFDEDAASGLLVAEIRERWPRLFGVCQRCGYSGIYYASWAHFVSGDW